MAPQDLPIGLPGTDGPSLASTSTASSQPRGGHRRGGSTGAVPAGGSAPGSPSRPISAATQSPGRARPARPGTALSMATGPGGSAATHGDSTSGGGSSLVLPSSSISGGGPVVVTYVAPPSVDDGGNGSVPLAHGPALAFMSGTSF